MQSSLQARMHLEMRVKFVLPLRAGLNLVPVLLLTVAARNCVGQTAASAEQQRQQAIALEQQGKNTEAEAAWRSVAQAAPANAEAYAHLGFLEARQERYKEAVPLYRKALVLDPAMPGLKMNLGLAQFKAGALKEAIQTFMPLLKSEPASSPEALRLTTLIGIAHLKRLRLAIRRICLFGLCWPRVALLPSSIHACSMFITKFCC
jgi:tetratricopeptide (TPR) repeat protein